MPDRIEDIKPRFHKNRNQMSDNDENNESELEEDEEDDDSFIEWSLRKCAAASLDMLSGIFGDAFLGALLPLVKDCLQDPNWIVSNLTESNNCLF